jgi:hypothetical protein
LIVNNRFDIEIVVKILLRGASVTQSSNNGGIFKLVRLVATMLFAALFPSALALAQAVPPVEGGNTPAQVAPQHRTDPAGSGARNDPERRAGFATAPDGCGGFRWFAGALSESVR